MKHYIVTAFILAASVFAGNNYGRAHVAEEKKQTFRITVLNTDGSPPKRNDSENFRLWNRIHQQ